MRDDCAGLQLKAQAARMLNAGDYLQWNLRVLISVFEHRGQVRLVSGAVNGDPACSFS